MNIKKNDKVIVLSGRDKGKTGEVLSADPKGGKVVVFKYKPKKDYKKTQGHRQPYTKIEIVSVK